MSELAISDLAAMVKILVDFVTEAAAAAPTADKKVARDFKPVRDAARSILDLVGTGDTDPTLEPLERRLKGEPNKGEKSFDRTSRASDGRFVVNGIPEYSLDEIFTAGTVSEAGSDSHVAHDGALAGRDVGIDDIFKPR